MTRRGVVGQYLPTNVCGRASGLFVPVKPVHFPWSPNAQLSRKGITQQTKLHTTPGPTALCQVTRAVFELGRAGPQWNYWAASRWSWLNAGADSLWNGWDGLHVPA
jgi:hypothetical protein